MRAAIRRFLFVVPRIRRRAPGWGTVALGLLATAGCPRDVVDAVGRNHIDATVPPDVNPPDVRDAAVEMPDPCVTAPMSPACAATTTWPNDISFTNSDEWLRLNHDKLTLLRPNVLVLDFYNPAPVATVAARATLLVNALAESSRYHFYSDSTAPRFLEYQMLPVIDLRDPVPAPGSAGSTRVPRDPAGNFDAPGLFTQAFADLIGIADPQRPGHNFTMCELFERGKVNEVWLAVGEDPPRGPLIMERKQMYDDAGAPLAGQFEPCAAAGGGGDGVCLSGSGINCRVTVRLAHLTPVRGVTCDVEIRTFPFESPGTLRAISYLRTNAVSFVNADFGLKFSVPFDSWYGTCDNRSTPCITYPTPTSAMGVPMVNTPAWSIPAFIQGCGSPRFPPNARWRNDYDLANAATLPQVESRCEHYGMRDGGGTDDMREIFNVDRVRTYYSTTYAADFGNDCGGAWQMYLRQSIPGRDNRAYDTDGRQMKNWWPYLFY